MTLLSVAILVGTELVGAGAAAGWAIGGLFQLGATITRMLEGVFILSALTGLFYFLRGGRARADPGQPVARRRVGLVFRHRLKTRDRPYAGADAWSIAQGWNAGAPGPDRRSALLVDLDGTLTDPAEGIVGCFRLALEGLGRSSPPAAELTWIIGAPLRRSFARVLGETGDPEEALRIYRGRYATEGLFEAVVYAGVDEALTELRAAGTRLFLCTAKPVVFAEPILRHFDLDLEAADCCMWGDREHDVLAATRHGIPDHRHALGLRRRRRTSRRGRGGRCGGSPPSQVPAALVGWFRRPA